MSPSPIDMAKAAQLLEAGKISQATYDRMVQSPMVSVGNGGMPLQNVGGIPQTFPLGQAPNPFASNHGSQAPGPIPDTSLEGVLKSLPQAAEAPAAPPPGPSVMDDFAAAAARLRAAPPPAPAAEAEGPHTGDVSVGKITAIRPAPAAPAAKAERDARLVTQEKLEDQANKQIAAMQSEAGARERQAQETADFNQRYMKEMEARTAKDDADRARDNAEIENNMKAVNASIEEYGNSKVDPNRFYHNAGTLGAIGMVVASMLGAYAGSDKPIQQLNRMVDSDIRAQETDLATKGKSLEAKRGVLHDMMQITNNKDAARQAARAVAFQNAEQQLKTIASKYDSPIIQANLEKGISQLQAQRIEAQGNVLATIQREQKAAAAAAAARAFEKQKADVKFKQDVYLKNMELEGKNAEKNDKREQQLRDRVVTIPDEKGNPQQYLAKTDDDAKKVKADAEAFANLKQDIQELRHMRETYSSEMWDRNAIARAKSLATNARMGLKNLEGLGVLSAHDNEVLQGQIPDEPLEVTSSDGAVFGALDQTLSSAERKFQIQAQSRLSGRAPLITQDAKERDIGIVRK